ncbi:MAG: choice-of-anchor B family protein [Planctomycetes bacterium]|nr:choice-of-anchor B family protein [Planctomycetota bacterium]
MKHCLVLAALGLCAASHAPVQSRNVTLLANFLPNDRFNDIWGYVDPGTGREFALLLSRQGTYVVETTDPTNPVQRGYIAGSLSGWSTSTWRDARTYGRYAYVVTEGGGGMQVIDLGNPLSPVFVRTHRPAGVTWGNTHNISIDLSTGKLYVVGTAGGMHIFDVAANPTNPPRVATYTTEYVHDVQVRDGTAFLSEINRSFLRLLDVRNLPAMPQVGLVGYGAAHQSWPSPDGDFVAAASEAVGGYVAFFDTTRLPQMQVLSTYLFPANPYETSVHNVFLRDSVLHCAWYTAGYVACDASDPRAPVTVGWYDSYPGVGVFSGAWGCYPYQPSGNVYLSDMLTGLYVLRLRGTPEHYGSGVGAPAGTVPKVATFGTTWLGSPSFALEARDVPANSPVWFFVGMNPANLSFGGHTLLVDTTIGGLAQATANARGIARTRLPLPNDPALDGLFLHAQVLIPAAGAPLGVAMSDGLRAELFVR